MQIKFSYWQPCLLVGKLRDSRLFFLLSAWHLFVSLFPVFPQVFSSMDMHHHVSPSLPTWHLQAVPWHHTVLHCPSELEWFSPWARHPELLSFCPSSFLGMLPMRRKCLLIISYFVAGLSIRLTALLCGLHSNLEYWKCLLKMFGFLDLLCNLVFSGEESRHKSKINFLNIAKSYNSSPELL